MGIKSEYNHSSFDSTSHAKRKCRLWDPITTLNITNPDRECLTCVGYAPSCRRRCRNPINQGNRSSAFALLEDMSYIDTSVTDISQMLRRLARYTLCLRYHQNQVHDMVATWLRQIDDATKLKYTNGFSAYKSNTPSTKRERLRQKYDAWDARGGQTRKQREEERVELTQMLRELLEKLEREGERANQQRQQDGREQRESKEKQRKKEREDEEERVREKETQRKKEQEARENEARERGAHEQEDRNERIRRRAEKLRREREEKEREKMEMERKEWDETWLRYVREWEEIKKNGIKGSSEKLRDILPWPVKSGCCEDITEATIKQFFQKALPQDTSLEKKFAFMKMECLKWHTDRIPRMFGTIQDKTLTDMFNTVAQVVIEIRTDIAKQLGR